MTVSEFLVKYVFFLNKHVMGFVHGSQNVPDVSSLNQCPQLCSLTLTQCELVSLMSPSLIHLIDVNLQVHSDTLTMLEQQLIC